MDLKYSEDDLAFRDEVRGYLKAELPASITEKTRKGKRLSKEDHDTWHAILNRKGWYAGSWPKEFGGQDWSPAQRHIFEEEYVRAGGPRIVPFGVAMLGPVLMAFGSKSQQDFYLPRILNGTDWWCQGYSEPGAGSDLASLKTRAERDGSHYVVNGQKTWTTLGQHANKIFCLVRTKSDGKPQEGISFLLIDMDTPGVEIRPIILLDGEHEVNEVFFDNARVPTENLVGEENKGWTYAKYLLSHERTNIAGVGFSLKALDNLKTVASKQRKAGRPLIDDPVFASKIMEVEFQLDAMRTSNLRAISAAETGQDVSAQTSMLKIKGTVIRQRINDLTREALGPYAIPFISEALEAGSNVEPVGPGYANPVASQYFNNRKMSIYGGSNEIQRNIITKLTMGG
ncbi:MAG: acyl-CoA dehydrogenase family protein [Pseudomonadota bacterium]